MNILWIGFGKMGEPMAQRARAGGHTLKVYDKSAERRNAAAQQNFAIVDDAAGAAGDVEAIVSSLPNDEAVVMLFSNASGLLGGVAGNVLLVETSTISTQASARVSAEAEAHGLSYVRAPVSGTVDAAREGRLTSILSGPSQAVEEVRSLVQAYSAKVLVVGDGEQARVMKLAINLMVNTLIASLSEAYALCRKAGIDGPVALDAICNSAIGSPHLRFKAEQLRLGDFTPTFTVSQTRKDLKLISDTARDLGVPLLIGGAVDQLMTAAESVGLSGEDYVACAKVAAQLAGLGDLDR